jgi:hypothetical protein
LRGKDARPTTGIQDNDDDEDNDEDEDNDDDEDNDEDDALATDRSRHAAG